MTRLALMALLLAAVYVLALGAPKPADAAVALVLATVVLLGLRGFLDPPAGRGRGGTLRRVIGFGPFALAVAWAVVRGTTQVAGQVLGLARPSPAGIVAVPVEERTVSGVACSALVSTLSPGEVLVDIDWDRREMLFHVMDASDPDAVRQEHLDFYRRWQRRVFP